MTNVVLPPRKPRWWLLAVILALTAGAISYFQLSEGMEESFRNPLSIMALMACAALTALWFLFFSGARWRSRLLGLATAGLAVGAFFGLVRLEGCTGNMLPEFAWRHSPVRDTTLPNLTAGELPRKEGAPAPMTATPHDFPEFLGPGRRAAVTGVRLSPDWTSQPPRQLWRQPIGAGWSGFAVVGDHAITQEQRGDQELVVCYDLRTGKVRWVHRDTVRFSELMGGDGPRATPTLVEGRVYAIGATGILNCLDGATGSLLWTRDVLQDGGGTNLVWGKSSSPLVFDNLVVVTLGQGGKGAVAAFDRQTGAPVWAAGTDTPAYCSPVLATLAGRRQVLVINAASVTAHDPADGQVLWTHAWPGDMAKCSQPVPLDGDRVFISAGYGIGCAMLQVQADQSGQLAVKELWKNNRSLKTRFTNVAVHNGFAYGLDDGILECVDLSNGQRKWRDGRYGQGQVLPADDFLLVQAESGAVALVAATPNKFDELTRFQAIKGKTWTNPALCGRLLLVRNADEAACYELPTRQKDTVKISIQFAKTCRPLVWL